MTDTNPYPGTPRWVKALGLAAVVLILVLAVVGLVSSGHGPERHFQSSPEHAAADAG